jgi:phosphocarrier protein
VKTIKHVIKNELGIHTRPAAAIVKTLSAFSSDAQIGVNGKFADGRRIFAVIGLELKQGDEMTAVLTGADEDEAASALHAFLNANY